jgi:hypothetical protein
MNKPSGSRPYKTKEEIVAEQNAKKHKQKVCEIAILPKHLPYLRQTADAGSVNITSALWLAAFAAYNVENELKLSPEFHGCYQKVYQFIEHKIG